jgi:hypothetical protein
MCSAIELNPCACRLNGAGSRLELYAEEKLSRGREVLPVCERSVQRLALIYFHRGENQLRRQLVVINVHVNAQ